MAELHFSSAFPGGNGQLQAWCPEAATVDVEITPDPGGEAKPFLQWFYFRLWGTAGQRVKVRLVNAGDAAYPRGWDDYAVLLRHGAQGWHRHPTTYAGGVLSWEAPLEGGWVDCAYFVPHDQPALDDLLAWASAQGAARHCWAVSCDGRPVEGLRVGKAGGTPIWVIARQHPGETMASWASEGLIRALLDPTRDSSQRLRETFEVHIVPNMNPDGAARGYLRTNAAGTNLNRAWQDPEGLSAPEVAGVWRAMAKSGVALFLDLHGDEALPYVFTAGCEGVPGFGDGEAGALWAYRQQRFRDRLEALNPAYQQRFGYPVAPPGRANLTMATAAVAHRFHCPAFTLEMPFKDDRNHPDPVEGWSPARSQALGADLLPAMLQTFEAGIP